MQNLLLAFILGIVLLPSLYLRYLPFKQFVTPKQKKQLAIAYICWFLILLGLDFYIINTRGISISLYKISVMAGWLPYLLINIALIPDHLEHHVFVAGMQCIYVMLIHGAAAMFIVHVISSFSLIEFCYYQAGLFLLMFAATYPFIKIFFNKVFLSKNAVGNRPYWRSVCLVPFLVVSDVFYLSYSNSILADQLFIPRLLLLPTFLMLMYAFSYDVNNLENKAELNAHNKLLSVQLGALKDYTRLMEKANQDMAVIRHDIRHYNRLLSELIQEKQYDAAQKLITASDDHMLGTAIQPFCTSSILNAALSMYVSKAEQEKIPLSHKIALPSLLNIDENELAMIACNLLENAFHACYKQPSDDRGIAITAKTEGSQLILSVANRYKDVVALNEDGLPFSNQLGHGLGMQSLKAFKEKYNATILCSQNDGWFKIMIYVAD